MDDLLLAGLGHLAQEFISQQAKPKPRPQWPQWPQLEYYASRGNGAVEGAAILLLGIGVGLAISEIVAERQRQQ